MTSSGPFILLLVCIVLLGGFPGSGANDSICQISYIEYTGGNDFAVKANICNKLSQEITFIICTEPYARGTVKTSYQSVPISKGAKEVSQNFNAGTDFVKRFCISESFNDLTSNDTHCIAEGISKCFNTEILHTVTKHKGSILTLAKAYGEISHTFLLWSYNMGSQKKQRPGLSKYLRELSDAYFDNGIKVMKKFYERGGTLETKVDTAYFNYDLKITSQYRNILEKIIEKSQKISTNLLSLMNVADADFKHFCEELLEEETKRWRKALGRYKVLNLMHSNRFAFNDFDNSIA